MRIFHIVLPEVWEGFSEADFYEAGSLETEGFIHCSFEDQLEGVLQRYYSNAEKIILLEIDPDKLTSKLINEPSTNNEIYPHIYGKINLDAVISAKERAVKINL